MSTSTLTRREPLQRSARDRCRFLGFSRRAGSSFRSSAIRHPGGCRAVGGERRRTDRRMGRAISPGADRSKSRAARGERQRARSDRLSDPRAEQRGSWAGRFLVDSIQGVATINGVAMPVRATSSYYPMQQDNTMIEESNRDRVSQVTEALAFWIAQDAQGIAAAGPRG